MSVEREKLLAEMAKLYTEREGAQLRRELEATGDNAPTTRMDKKVRGALFRSKYKLHVRVAGLIAACVAFAIVLPLLINQPVRLDMGGGAMAEPTAMAPPIAPGAAAPVPAAPAPVADFAMPGAPAPAAGGAAAQMEEDSIFPELYDEPFVQRNIEHFGGYIVGTHDEPSAWFALPALPFPLPEGFEVVIGPAFHDYTRGYRLTYNQTHMIALRVTPASYYTAADFSDWLLYTGYSTVDMHGITIYYRDQAEWGSNITFSHNQSIYEIRGDTAADTLLRLAEAIITGG